MRTALLAAAVALGAPADPERLPPLPDKEGFAGSFAGVSGGALVVAGGANFPGKKPWEGGAKAWTDAAFVLDRPGGRWRPAGKLPRPLAYGVSASHAGGVVCAGGSDADRHHRDAFRIEWKGGKLLVTDLPPLPGPLANGCGALVGDTLYLAGGQEKPDGGAVASAWALDLSANNPKWRALDPLPGGGRVLPVAAAFGGAFWVVGGAALDSKGGKTVRRYLTDAYRYDPKAGWKRVADLPHPVAAAPSPAPAAADGFFVLGGDDGAQVGVPPDKHRGFRSDVLRYDPKADRWVAAGELPAPRVTAPCVPWEKGWVIPSGEVRPGVRSPDVPRFRPNTK